MHYQTKFDNKKINSSKDILETVMFIRILSVTFTLNAVIQVSHRTLQLMMQYYQTKFGCKWNSSLEDTIEIVILCSFKPSLCKLCIFTDTSAKILGSLEMENQLFRMTHHLMIIHHHNKFGFKKKKNGWAVQEIPSGHDQTNWQNYRQIHGQSHSHIPPPPPSHLWGVGVHKKKIKL